MQAVIHTVLMLGLAPYIFRQDCEGFILRWHDFRPVIAFDDLWAMHSRYIDVGLPEKKTQFNLNIYIWGYDIHFCH